MAGSRSPGPGRRARGELGAPASGRGPPRRGRAAAGPRRRSSSWRFPAPARTRCSSTGISTSSPRWSAGARAWGPGRRSVAATGSTGGAPPTTATRRSRPSPPCRRCRPRGAARPVRHPRRDLRGEREPRPPRLHGGSLKSRIGSPEPGGVPRLVLRQLRPALDRDIAPRPGRAGSCRWRSSARASTRARAGSSRRASGSCASSCRASRTSRRGRSAARPPRGDPARAGPAGQGGGRRRSATSAPACPSSPAAGRPTHDPTELVLARTWRPALAITGADGIPSIADGGNVLRPRTALRSRSACRRPSTHRPPRAGQGVLETDPPYGARVRFTPATPRAGAGTPRPWPAGSRSRSSAPPRSTSGGPPMSSGVGGIDPVHEHARRAVPPTRSS